MGRAAHSTSRGAATVILIVFAAVRCSSFGGEDTPGPPPASPDADADAASSDAPAPDAAVIAPRCQGDVCDCDGDRANGRERNVLGSDALNCGACGRACLPVPPLDDRTCTRGVCTPTVVANGQSQPGALASRGDVIAWAVVPGDVLTAAPPSWAPNAALAPRLNQPIGSLAFDDTYAFAAYGTPDNGVGGIYRFERAKNCAPSCYARAAADAGDLVPNSPVLDSAALFYLEYGSGSNLDYLRRTTVDFDGGSILHGAPALGPLAIGGAFVYVAEHVVPGLGQERLMVRPTGDCAPSQPQCTVELVPNVLVRGIAADGDAVYYTDAITLVLARKQRSLNVPVRVLVSTLGTAGSVAVDAKDVYFTDVDPPATDGAPSTTSRVLRIGKDGLCNGYVPCPQPLITGIADLTSFAIGDTMVFATSGSGGTVLRTPK